MSSSDCVGQRMAQRMPSAGASSLATRTAARASCVVVVDAVLAAHPGADRPHVRGACAQRPNRVVCATTHNQGLLLGCRRHSSECAETQ